MRISKSIQGAKGRKGGLFLLAEHVSDEIHLLLSGSNLLCRRGLRATESEHRHDCG